ncbi:MAG: SRPBCC family protein [Paludibacteraceae bacterium]|nr:SRPBCC family protein [Paludibacteraceae bacterium]
MSEAKYESKVSSIPCDARTVYQSLGNLENLNRVRDFIPQDKVQELEIASDSIRMKVDGLGQKITIRIVDREENKMLKFGLDNIPMQANFWIQLVEVNPTDTRIRLTLHADIPFMFKMMLDKKIQTGLDQASEMLAKFPYQLWTQNS